MRDCIVFLVRCHRKLLESTRWQYGYDYCLLIDRGYWCNMSDLGYKVD
nr:MAG TPA: hypothetical protein [Caudoviricetes sp.]